MNEPRAMSKQVLFVRLMLHSYLIMHENNHTFIDYFSNNFLTRSCFLVLLFHYIVYSARFIFWSCCKPLLLFGIVALEKIPKKFHFTAVLSHQLYNFQRNSIEELASHNNCHPKLFAQSRCSESFGVVFNCHLLPRRQFNAIP